MRGATECSVLTFRATSPEYAPRAGLSVLWLPSQFCWRLNSHEGLWASGRDGPACLLPSLLSAPSFLPISSGWASFHSTFPPPTPRLISHEFLRLRRNLVWLYLTSGPSFLPNLVCVGLASPTMQCSCSGLQGISFFPENPH